MEIVVAYSMIICLVLLAPSIDAKSKSKQQEVISQSKEDPADLANYIPPKCASNEGDIDIAALFAGVFLSTHEVDDLIKETNKSLSTKPTKKSDSSRVGPKNRISKKIATVQTFSTKNDTCCETDLYVTSPKTILVNNIDMTVVTSSSSLQYVHEGVCTHAEIRCGQIGTCVQRMRSVHILVYDPLLITNPPVRAVRHQINSHCECMNVGRDD